MEDRKLEAGTEAERDSPAGPDDRNEATVTRNEMAGNPPTRPALREGTGPPGEEEIFVMQREHYRQAMAQMDTMMQHVKASRELMMGLISWPLP